MRQLRSEDVRVAADVGDDRTESGAHRLEQADRGALAARGEREQRERAMEIMDVVSPAQKSDAIAEPVRCRERLQAAALEALATDEQHGSRSVVPVPRETTKRLHHDLIALDRLKSADASQHRRARVDPELLAHCPRVRARTKGLRIDSVEDHADLAWLGDDSFRAVIGGQRRGNRDDDIGPSRGQPFNELPIPRVRMRPSVLGVNHATDAGQTSCQRRLVPDPAVGMDDVRGNRLDLSREHPGPDE